MRRNILFLALTLCLTCGIGEDLLAAKGEWQDISAGNADIRSLLVGPGDPAAIYIGAKNRVLKSTDGGSTWISLLSVNGRYNRINFLYIDPRDKNSLYAATNNGLFYSCDQGKGWQRIFKGKDRLENECRALQAWQGKIYLGTAAGLFSGNVRERLWNKVSSLDNQEIFDILTGGEKDGCLYVYSRRGLFINRDVSDSWRRVFFILSKSDDPDAGAADEEEGVTAEGCGQIALGSQEEKVIYLALAKGVYKSRDAGESWEALSGSGFIGGRVRSLAASVSGKVYAINSKKVFVYSRGFWEEVSPVLTAGELYSLCLDGKGTLYLAASAGLFKREAPAPGGEQEGAGVFLDAREEPAIQDVQRAAIRYAEVSPEKIAQWRRQAARKAWLPQLRVGIQREASDLWHWEGGSTVKCDDDTLRKGREYIGWDITMSWDLGELIWNGDQASIDVRSKLMVELRDDILDNVTKLYFERLRLKMEINGLPIEERKKRLEKELRVREITAALDAFTGGYFSRSTAG